MDSRYYRAEPGLPASIRRRVGRNAVKDSHDRSFMGFKKRLGRIADKRSDMNVSAIETGNLTLAQAQQLAWLRQDPQPATSREALRRLL